MKKPASAGQVAIVTGGSRGIGRAICKELAARGTTIVFTYRSNESAAKDTAAEVTALSGTASYVRADVMDEAEVKKLVRSVIDQFGRIDILVCNAGVVRDHLVAAMPIGAWDAVIKTNLRGTFLSIRETVPYMMRQKGGSIVNVSSVIAAHAGSGQCNYAASKAGIEALTRSLAIELASKRIRVNAVAPGLIVSDMTAHIRELAGDQLLDKIPLRRYGQAAEVARAVGFLSSADASYITGAVLPVSGGLGL